MESETILVIILSIALIISLIIWIVAGVLCIQILKKIKSASDTAKEAVSHVEEFTSQLKNAGRLTTMGTVVSQVTKLFKGKK